MSDLARTMNAIATSLPCAHCHAGRRQPCKSKFGRLSTRPHSARIEPLWAAYRLGLRFGLTTKAASLTDEEQP